MPKKRFQDSNNAKNSDRQIKTTNIDRKKPEKTSVNKRRSKLPNDCSWEAFKWFFCMFLIFVSQVQVGVWKL